MSLAAGLGDCPVVRGGRLGGVPVRGRRVRVRGLAGFHGGLRLRRLGLALLRVVRDVRLGAG